MPAHLQRYPPSRNPPVTARRAVRPCLACNTPTKNNPAYCPACQPEYQQRMKAAYQGDWEKKSKTIREEWLKQHGPLCPGWRRAAHLVHPRYLCVDHVVARDPSVLAVLCRSCNSTKGNEERKR